MREDYFGLRGGTGLKLGRMMESFWSMYSIMSVHLSLSLCMRFK